MSSLSETIQAILCLILTGSMERKLVLKCLNNDLISPEEMYLLLTDDIVEFDLHSDLWHMDTMSKQSSSPFGHKYSRSKHEYVLLSLLKARCPVSNSISRELNLNSL